MKQKRILIVHPYDKSTVFLERIKNHLQSQWPHETHYFGVKPTPQSHSLAINRISDHPKNGIIIFLGHGRSDKLFGSKGDNYHTFIDEDAKIENPEQYYFHEDFITLDNVQMFKGKRVFALACNSRLEIANQAIENGAAVFFGFGNIPTSEIEFEEVGEKVSGDVVRTMKAELNYIIKTGLEYSIKRNDDFQGLLDVIDLIGRQRISDIIANQKGLKERHILGDYLYFFKKEAAIFGDPSTKILG